MDVEKFLEQIHTVLKKLFNNEKSNDSKGSINYKIGDNKKKLPNVFIGVLCVFLIGIVCVIASSYFKSTSTIATNNPNKATDSTQKYNEDYETELQNKLKNTLQKIDGVGNVEVMIYFEGGDEQVPAVNINDAVSTTEEKDTAGGTRTTTQKNNGSTVVITNDGSKSEPLILKKYKPKVTGVCVVADGAQDKVTELKITRAVTNLFSLPENKVNVFPMKN